MYETLWITVETTNLNWCRISSSNSSTPYTSMNLDLKKLNSQSQSSRIPWYKLSFYSKAGLSLIIGSWQPQSHENGANLGISEIDFPKCPFTSILVDTKLWKHTQTSEDQSLFIALQGYDSRFPRVFFVVNMLCLWASWLGWRCHVWFCLLAPLNVHGRRLLLPFAHGILSGWSWS